MHKGWLWVFFLYPTIPYCHTLPYHTIPYHTILFLPYHTIHYIKPPASLFANQVGERGAVGLYAYTTYHTHAPCHHMLYPHVLYHHVLYTHVSYPHILHVIPYHTLPYSILQYPTLPYHTVILQYISNGSVMCVMCVCACVIQGICAASGMAAPEHDTTSRQPLVCVLL